VALSQVKNPKLKEVIEDIKKYWKDSTRPALTSFSCEAVGGNLDIAENAGLMFTLASCGFGLHDDILDRSSHKHLRMTILGLHGIDCALLAGDLFIFKSWTVGSEMIRSGVDPLRVADVMKAYGNLSVEICEAELMDTLCRRKLDLDIEYYKKMLKQEMAEMEACSRIGAMLGNGMPKEIEALSNFGRQFGFISRLGDDMEDCLNVKGDLLHRIKYESVPLPLLYAAKSSSERYSKIRNIIKKKNIGPLDAESVVEFCFESEAFEYTRLLAAENRAEAICNLESLVSSTSLNVLLFMLDKAYDRVVHLCV